MTPIAIQGPQMSQMTPIAIPGAADVADDADRKSGGRRPVPPKRGSAKADDADGADRIPGPQMTQIRRSAIPGAADDADGADRNPGPQMTQMAPIAIQGPQTCPAEARQREGG